MNDDEQNVGGKVTSEIGPWAMVPVWVLTKGLKPAELVTYIALRSFADRGGDAHPYTATIAKRANLAIGTVRNAIQALREKGLIETTERYRQDGSLAGLDFKLFDIDPNPGTEIKPRRTGEKGGPKPGKKASVKGASTDVPPSTEGEIQGGSTSGDVGGSTPTDVEVSTNWCTQEEHTIEHTTLEHHSVPASQVPRDGAEVSDSGVDGQLTIDGGPAVSAEELAKKLAAERAATAMGLGRAWLELREKHNCPVIRRGSMDPLMALRNVLVPVLEAGYTENEIKFALAKVDWSVPRVGALDSALAAVRGGWRTPEGWKPGDAGAGTARGVGRQRQGTSAMAGTNLHVDDLSEEQRQKENPFRKASRQSDYLGTEQRGAVA